MRDFIKQQKLVYLAESSFDFALAHQLNLTKVKAPLFLKAKTGVQDNLCGTEKSVSFTSKATGEDYEVVHSLAKWKRELLSDQDFESGFGVYANMKAIRADEEKITPIHSMYVDQWDWEVVIDEKDRNLRKLKAVVNKVYSALLMSVYTMVSQDYLDRLALSGLPQDIKFIHTEELLELYPDLSPKEREREITKKHGAVFLMGIGGALKDGKPHDLRSADYDDWTSLNQNGHKGLNGDILVWCPSINDSLELSSMGIRVDKETLKRQLKLTGEEYKLDYDWHKKLMSGEMKQTIGGGIGKSRMIMFLLQLDNIHSFKY